MAASVHSHISWGLLVLLLLSAVAINRDILDFSSKQELDICFLVDDISQDLWQSIHYGFVQGSAHGKVPIQTHNLMMSADNQTTPELNCSPQTKLIVSGWQKPIDLPNPNFPYIGNEFSEINREGPIFMFGHYYGAKQKVSMLLNFIAQQKPNETVNIAILLGEQEMASVRFTVEQFQEQINSYPKLKLVEIQHYRDNELAQYVGVSSLLNEAERLDYLIATPSAISIASKFADNMEREHAQMLSLSISKNVLELLSDGKVLAAIDDKPVRQGEYLFEFATNKIDLSQLHSLVPLRLIHAGNTGSINVEDTFVPYGYRVIYNSGQ